MPSATEMRRLHVYAEGVRIGHLSESEDLWTFEYAPEWATHPGGFDLSPALPRSTPRHVDGGSHRPVQWFFDNLLPEEQLRIQLAHEQGVRDAEDAFGLLERLGAESVGALTLLPDAESPVGHGTARILPPAALSARIRKLPNETLTRAAPKRMSIAGAQHKLLVIWDGERLLEPVGQAASTHILKPDHPARQDYPASAWLERLTMDLASAAGLRVPKTWLLHVPEPVYLVERFDRVVRPDGQVRRLHVIDACQLLNRSRRFKHSGASVEALQDIIGRVGDRLRLPHQLFRWLVFNVLIGNDDCHLKNLSFVMYPDHVELAPHYDLLSTAVYHTKALADEHGRWPDIDMAVTLANGVRRFRDVSSDILIETAGLLGVPEPAARRMIRSVTAQTLRRLDVIYANHFPDETATPSEPIHKSVPADLAPDRQENPALVRKMLRLLRYNVLAEMHQRVIAAGAPPRHRAARRRAGPAAAPRWRRPDRRSA